MNENENEDVRIVLAQAPSSCTLDIANEALVCTCGNVSDAIHLLWQRDAGIGSGSGSGSGSTAAAATSKTPRLLDPVQEKWASVRDIADAISNARIDFQKGYKGSNT